MQNREVLRDEEMLFRRVIGFVDSQTMEMNVGHL